MTLDKRIHIGAAAGGLAILAAVTASAISYEAAQDQTQVAQGAEAQSLAQSVAALKARLAALDAVRRDEVADLRKAVVDLKSGLAAAHESGAALAQANARADRLERDEAARRDEIADLRRSVAELRTGVAATHEFGAALAQVNARADRLEHDGEARLDKLGERVDHDAAAHNAELAARLDRLEKKLASPVVASIAPQPAASTSTALVRPPGAAPTSTEVSAETTGSIQPRGVIHGWSVREIHGGLAIVEGPGGLRQIGPGDRLAGVGRVERIERTASGPMVFTDRGIISGAGPAAYRMGPYGAYGGGYGPPEGEF
jgi:prefoldin subunit 5